MELSALQSFSPTLLGKMLRDHNNAIKKGLTVFNSKNCYCLMCFRVEETNEFVSLSLDQLPEEIRKGIHDYTTRLTAEKLLIETALENSKTAIP